MRLTARSVFSALALIVATRLGAQTVPSVAGGRAVQVGDRARIRVAERDANGRGIDCEARVTAVAGDTLVIENTHRWGACPSRVYGPATLSHVDVSYRSRGSRAVHGALGLAAGAVAGGGLSRVLINSQCDSVNGSCESDIDDAVTVLGALAGGVIGGLVGLALPAGPRWESLSTATPVRVAGLALRPSIRVSFR